MMSVPVEGKANLMNFLKLPLACLLIISTAFAIPVAGQKRRGPDKPAVKTPAAPAPAPVTLETLLAADSYNVYAEVRGVGQLVRSNAATEVLDPVLKLGGPPQNFIDIVTWLKSHADDLMTSRLLIAADPSFKEVPDAVIAIEMATADDATKFEAQLNGVLPKLLPPVPPSSPEEAPPLEKPANATAVKQGAAPAAENKVLVPRYYIQRANSLIVLTPKPVQLKKLRPRGTKPFSEDTNFRVAYNRFSSEPVFVFVNTAAMKRKEEERSKQYEEERKKAEEAEKAEAEKRAAEGAKEGEAGQEGQPGEGEEGEGQGEEMEPPPPEEVPSPIVEEPPKEPTEAEVLASAVSSLRYSLMGGVPDIPDAVGIGFSPENDSFDVRVLLIDAPGEYSDPIPIFTQIVFGDPISPESSRVLPADSELVLTMALDLHTIHARIDASETPGEMSVVMGTAEMVETGAKAMMASPPEYASPLRTIEKILKVNTKDELLPLLGSEVAVSLPIADFNPFGSPGVMRPVPRKEAEEDKEKPAPRGPFIVISLRDKEGMKRMMPRLLEGFAGKAAAALAQTERREDTELVSYAGMFAYAFVGDFLVLAGDAATTRHVVESYLKGETLAADSNFKNYTRWQPRQILGQVYVSPVLSDTYRSWFSNPNSQISDEARGFLTHLGTTASQPITYSLSNDGLGALHELHVPKSFLLMTVASIASSGNPPETVRNERAAMGTLWQISYAQSNYKEQKGGSYGSLEELVKAELLQEDTFKADNYKFSMTLTPEGFEVSAVPVEYGKTGKLSFFIDQSGVMRGGDHAGTAATASDDPVN
jgi:hypothetical protein